MEIKITRTTTSYVYGTLKSGPALSLASQVPVYWRYDRASHLILPKHLSQHEDDSIHQALIKEGLI